MEHDTDSFSGLNIYILCEFALIMYGYDDMCSIGNDISLVCGEYSR